MLARRALIATAALALAACPDGAALPPEAPAVGRIEIVAELPHDPSAYTQGLLWSEGRLWESLGGYGSSAVRAVDPESGEVLAEARLPRTLFGEGLTRVGDELVQLTWREGRALLWRLPGLVAAGERPWEGEGWGVTWDGESLVASDGSATIRFLDPETHEVRRAIEVRREGRSAAYLNELEWIDGRIFANVWFSDQILEIDPGDGRVVAVYDASFLRSAELGAEAEALNGIAWDPERELAFLTGKRWARLFLVRFVRGG